MSRTLCLAVLALALHLSAQAAEQVLAHYDFDGDEIATGPYTLMVFESARGRVSLTERFRLSGRRAVEIQDVSGDGEFAELQGYFDAVPAGHVRLHFAFMSAEPLEPFNIAFAGAAHFTMRPDGMAIWLSALDGELFHLTDGTSLPLFPIHAFTWYTTDLVYDVDRGTYDLLVREEGRDEPLVELRDQPNAVGFPGSTISKFSFIGDPPGVDTSNARVYVDDIRITADRSAAPAPFTAPGRRMLFVDIWDHYERSLYRRPGCPPVVDAADFALSAADLRDLAASGHLEVFHALAAGKRTSLPSDLPEHLRGELKAMMLWGLGCSSQAEGRSSRAIRRFRQAAEQVPRAGIYPMSEVMALAAGRRWAEADALFVELHPGWLQDPRFPAISAGLGIARGDLEQAERWLLTGAERFAEQLRRPLVRRLWSGKLDRELVLGLQAEFGAQWAELVETALIAEQRYFVLLWQDRFEQARDYARRMAARFVAMDLPADRWLERQGDAAFYSGDYERARRLYEAGLQGRPALPSLLLKLSDVHFKLGDLQLERAYRERIYGSLTSLPQAEMPSLPGVGPDAAQGQCPAPRP